MVKRTVYVPRFGSQLGSSQRDEPQPDQTQTQTPSHGQRDERGGNKLGRVRGEEKTRFVLKVKLPKLNNSTVSKEDKTARRLVVEDTANKTKTTVSRGGAGTDSGSVGRDVFFFSQRPTSTPMNEKEKAKHTVLKTISRMLEENQLIRQRLAPSQQGQQRLH